MKKIFVILVILFCLTGCEATYELRIDNDKYSEKTEIDNFSVSSWNEGDPSYKSLIDSNYKTILPVNHNIPGFLEDYTKIPGYDYYNQTLINTPTNYGLIYDYDFNKMSFLNSTFACETFEDLSVIDTDSYIKIDSGNKNYMFDNDSLDKVTVVISSNYYVTSNNADEVKNNKCYWYFTKNDKTNKKISMVLDKSRKQTDIVMDLDKGNNLKWVLGAIGVLILGTAIFIFVKVKNSNK